MREWVQLDRWKLKKNPWTPNFMLFTTLMLLPKPIPSSPGVSLCLELVMWNRVLLKSCRGLNRRFSRSGTLNCLECSEMSWAWEFLVWTEQPMNVKPSLDRRRRWWARPNCRMKFVRQLVPVGLGWNWPLLTLIWEKGAVGGGDVVVDVDSKVVSG